MMLGARVLWWLATAALTLPFFDVLPRTFARGEEGWIRHETAARVWLGVLEVGAVVAWLVWLRGEWPVTATPFDGVALFGGVCALAGGATAAYAKLALGRWFSATFGVKRGHTLVTSGPYAWVRHPIYLGILLYIGGSALVWNDAALLVLAVVIGILFTLHIRIEERLFAEHFGAAHADYRARTPALLPWPRPRRES